MEARETDDNESSPRWVAHLFEVLQPVGTRAGRLAAMELFDGFRWSELEQFAALLEDVTVPRGARLTVQGRDESRLWVISEGEALVSADARPLRVVGHGGAAGVAGMLYSIVSPETTIALTPIRAFTAGPAEFETLVSNARMRRRMTAIAGQRLRSHRPAKPR